MERIYTTAALSLVAVSLVAALAIAGQRETHALDLTLSAEEIWQRAQDAQAEIRFLKVVRTFDTSFANSGERTQGFISMRVDLDSRVVWATQRAIIPDPENSPGQQETFFTGISRELGVEPKQLEQLQLITFFGDERRLFARAVNTDWVLVSRGLLVVPYISVLLDSPGRLATAGLEIAGQTSVHGQPVYWLKASNPGLRQEELLIDGNFRLVRHTVVFEGNSRQVTTYSDFNEPFNLPSDLPQ